MPMAEGVCPEPAACGHRGRSYVGTLGAQEDGSFHPGLLQWLYCEEIPRNRSVHVRRRERVWTRRGRMRLSARGAEDRKCLSRAREGRSDSAGALEQERSESLCATPRGDAGRHTCVPVCAMCTSKRKPPRTVRN